MMDNLIYYFDNILKDKMRTSTESSSDNCPRAQPGSQRPCQVQCSITVALQMEYILHMNQQKGQGTLSTVLRELDGDKEGEGRGEGRGRGKQGGQEGLRKGKQGGQEGGGRVKEGELWGNWKREGWERSIKELNSMTVLLLIFISKLHSKQLTNNFYRLTKTNQLHICIIINIAPSKQI